MDTQMCIHLIRCAHMSKDVGIRIRVEKELREAFVNACRNQDVAASEVLREFMRLFAEQQHYGAQSSLFPLLDKKPNNS
jgi:hypothetical protein